MDSVFVSITMTHVPLNGISFIWIPDVLQVDRITMAAKVLIVFKDYRGRPVDKVSD